MDYSDINYDKYNKSSDIDNYVKVPWEDNSASCNNDYIDHPCWRIMSVNSDDSITIVRDRNVYKNVVYDFYGWNDLLYSFGRISNMYYVLYGEDGYQNMILSDYYHLLQTFDICLN